MTENEEINRKENNREIITRTRTLSMNGEVEVRKKNKTCNEEPLVLKYEKQK